MALKREIFAYASVIEALSKGLYPDKLHVLREFVQNSYDALNELKSQNKSAKIEPIEIRITKPSILIYDKGIGMDENQMSQYRYLGYSDKDKSSNVGFRGIGKQSGISIAKKIIVSSSKLGVSKKYVVIIDVDAMFIRLRKSRNPSLEDVLREFSNLTEENEKADLHYTMVELLGVEKESDILLNSDRIANYLSMNVPVPFDPTFMYSGEVAEKVRLNVPSFFECELLLNSNPIYKQYPKQCLKPNYIPIFKTDDSQNLLAYCWYVKNSTKGQFTDNQIKGLYYRLNNFAVGDMYLTRKDLWKTTPERAFHFFGEIHLIDKELIPSSDRTNFEDNDSRELMYDRCRRISQQLNKEAGTESEQRRFSAKLSSTEGLVEKAENDLKRGSIDIDLKPEIQFQIRSAIDDVNKRLKRTTAKRKKDINDRQLINKSSRIKERARSLLNSLDKKKLFDITKAIPMTDDSKALYKIIIQILKEELRDQPSLLEKIIRRIKSKMESILDKR